MSMSLMVLGGVIGWAVLAAVTLRGTRMDRSEAGGRGGAIG
jgi:hypothetical protein